MFRADPVFMLSIGWTFFVLATLLLLIV